MSGTGHDRCSVRPQRCYDVVVPRSLPIHAEQVIQIYFTILPTNVKAPLSDVVPSRRWQRRNESRGIAATQAGITDKVIQNLRLVLHYCSDLRRGDRGIWAPPSIDPLPNLFAAPTSSERCAEKCNTNCTTNLLHHSRPQPFVNKCDDRSGGVQ